MAGKNGKNSKRNGKKRRGKRTLTKRQKDVVEDIVEKKLVESKETKYVNDGLNDYLTLTSLDPDVDTVNTRLYKKLPISILEGDDFGTRDGDKVMLKTLQLKFRVKPQDAFDYLPISGGNPGTDWFSNAHFRGHILRVDKGSTLNAGDIDQCIRRPTENWMDTRQLPGRAKRKAFSIVHKFDFKVKYRDVTGLDGSTVPPEMWLLRVPEITHKSIVANVNKRMLFNATSGNEPLKYDYYMFMTWRDYRATAYTATTFPAYINYWLSYTFQDI